MQHSRRINLRIIWSFFLVSLAFLVRGQEMWGLTTSNYAGSTGTILNPTSLLTSKVYMDINLLTADAFFENNYAYIHAADYSPLMFFSGSPDLPEYGPDDMPFDHFKGENKKYVYSSILVKGPSFMVAIGRHGFALHTGARVLNSANAIPYEIPNFGYYGLDYAPQQNVNYTRNNFGAGSMTMGEIALSYAFAFRRIEMEDWTAGITVKRLFSLAGGYMRVNDLDYIVLNDTTINIRNLNAEFGFSFPMDYNTNDFPDDGPWIKGGGFGIDLGVTYQDRMLSYQKKRISKLCRQKYIDYDFRIGISLLDLGYATFRNDAQLHSYNDVSEYWEHIDTLNYYNFNQLVRTISDVFYDDPDSSLTAEKITVFLPTALSLQADYRIRKNWYAGAVIIQPLRLGKAYIRRPAQIAVVPRYETRNFEAALPISLYDYKYPRLGASVRYAFLTIGTEELLGLLGFTRFTGLDFYVSLKFNLIRGKCAKSSRNVPCENEEYGIRKKR